MPETTITAQAQALALVLAAADRTGMPAPTTISVWADSITVHLNSLDDLLAWSAWGDGEITCGEPHEYGDKWSMHHNARVVVYDLPLDLIVVQFGVMTEPESYECRTCGARFGVPGGFVANGEYDDDAFEAELARHMDGICFGAAGVGR